MTLPLNGGRSSAVLTVSEPDAVALLAMNDVVFGEELTRRYHERLGPMRPVGGRYAVPVVTTYAQRFVGRRFALLGDAAVGMHPTTAHGFNFGLLGQGALANVLRRAVSTGRDVADPVSLQRYEAAHRAETRLFFLAAETIMRLYAAGDNLPARLLRDGALRMGNLRPFRRALTARMRDPDRVQRRSVSVCRWRIQLSDPRRGSSLEYGRRQINRQCDDHRIEHETQQAV